jgi:hypothetical protein
MKPASKKTVKPHIKPAAFSLKFEAEALDVTATLDF